MEKKIAALLNNNLRVIIPDFGAFIIRQQQPRIVVFNEELKNYDGLLLEYIMKTEGIEKDIAEQLLSDYTDHAKRLLESGSVLSIEGIGELQRDRRGKIIFTQEDEVKTAEEKPVVKKGTAAPVPRKKPVARTKAVQAAKPKPIIKPPPVEPVDEVQAEMKPIPVPEKPEPVSGRPEPVPEKPEPVPEKPEPVLPTAMSPGFWSRPMVRWIFIIVLANVLVLTFFRLKDNFRNEAKETQKTFGFADSVLQQLTDSVMVAVADTSLILRGEVTITPLENSELAKRNLRYYIVAGCFKDEINADLLVTSLDSLGYKAEKFGKIKDLYAVSYASFDDKELAAKELARIRNELHPDAWMTRF